MRKVAGILIVSAMLLPVGAIAAAPAGSVTTGLTCTKLTGTTTWTPGVPLASKPKAASTVGTLTLTPSGALSYKATAKVTKGQFIAKTLVVIGTFTPVKPGCSTAPMTKATVVIKKGTKALIK